MKKTELKRLVCGIIAIIILIVIMPITMLSIVDVNAMTNDEIKSRISSFQSIMDGHYWNAGKSESELISAVNRGDYGFGLTNSACSLSGTNDAAHHSTKYGCNSNTFNGSRQCAGFAEYMAYVVFGSKTTTGNGWTKYTSAAGITLEPGDIIRYSGHSAMVWYTEGDTLYVAEANWWDKQKRWCQVHFGESWSSVSSVKNNLQYIWKHPTDTTPSYTPVDLGTDFYTYIFNQPAWKPIECDPNGTNVYLATDKWTANQHWYATRNSDGSYTFRNAANNKCLDVDGAYDINNTNIKVYDYNGSDAQKWFVYFINNQYVFQPKCSSDKVLDLENGGTADGTNLQLYSRNGSDAQSFNIYKIECQAEKPSIKVDYENIHEAGAATISWDTTNYTNNYEYYLTEYPEWYAYTTNTKHGTTNNTSISFSGLKSGRYNCFIHAISHKGIGSNQSNWVSFNVYADDYIPTKTVVSNNHIYALYDYEMSWSFARDLCTDLGGNLVTITSAEENQVISNLISCGSKDAYWLGASDNVYEPDKNYKWVTGEAFSYSNWMSGEPSSSGTDGEKEHFIEIRKSYGNKWNDVNNISKSNKGFILEIDISNLKPTAEAQFDNNRYLLFDKNTTWTEAKTVCGILGGQLASLESNAENEFMKDFLKKGTREWYYLGGQKVNNTWQWENGKTVNTVSWAGNAAEWKGTNLMMYKTNGSCIGLNNAYYPEKDISRIGFVCEIENYYKDEPTPPPANPTPLPTLKPTAEPSPMPYSGTVTVGTAAGSAGDEVTVPVSISGNPGVSSFTFRLNFDKTKLTPVSVTKNSSLPGSLTSNIQQSGIDKNNLDYVTAMWANEANYSNNGTLFEVRFKIAESVSNGEDIPVSITYAKGNVVNQDLNDVDLNLINGSIAIGKIIYGDIFGDGTVNNKDLVRLRQYLAEWNITLTENERKAADVFRDGEINNKDLVRLSQYLADWDVKLGE